MFKNKAKHITLSRFRELYDALYPSLCLFANKYLNDLDISKDVVQDIFIKVWEQKSLYTTNTLKSFLYISVKNRCIDYLRGRHHKLTVNSSFVDFEEMETEDFFLAEVATTETYTYLENAIKALPTKSEKLIRLTMDDYSNKEIAEELSITLNTVKSQKRIAYQKLRNSLSYLNSLITFL